VEPPPRASRRKGEMTGTVARERGCLGAVAALHPTTNPEQGVLALKVSTADFYFFSCLSCV